MPGSRARRSRQHAPTLVGGVGLTFRQMRHVSKSEWRAAANAGPERIPEARARAQQKRERRAERNRRLAQ